MSDRPKLTVVEVAYTSRTALIDRSARVIRHVIDCGDDQMELSKAAARAVLEDVGLIRRRRAKS